MRRLASVLGGLGLSGETKIAVEEVSVEKGKVIQTESNSSTNVQLNIFSKAATHEIE